jgi:hypothetical protein
MGLEVLRLPGPPYLREEYQNGDAMVSRSFKDSRQFRHTTSTREYAVAIYIPALLSLQDI